MTDNSAMNKSTLAFIVIAACLVGALFGYGVTDKDQPTLQAKTTVESGSSANSNGALPYRFITDAEFSDIKFDEFGTAIPYNIGENVQTSKKPFKRETLEVKLALDETTEYKVVMQQGDSIVYEWHVNNGEVYTDFHAHPPGEGEFFTRYSETEGDSNQGSIVAAYDGQHGWFWMNISDNPITISLTVAGFFDEIIEIDLESEAGY